jgi:prepilin peptidase CpaA
MISIETHLTQYSDATFAMPITKRTMWTCALAFPLVAGPFWCLAWSFQSHWLGSLSGLVLLAILATCTVTDVRSHRIYNWATYSAFLWAISINVFASLWRASGESHLIEGMGTALVGPTWLGGVGIGQSMGGAALCFLITLAGYHMSGRGAGDVKLAATLGILLGVNYGVFAVAYSYIVAAIAIIIWSTWSNGPWAIAKAGLRSIGKLFGPLWPFPPSSSDTELLLRPIPLGPYFAIGTLLVVLELVPTWQ